MSRHITILYQKMGGKVLRKEINHLTNKYSRRLPCFVTNYFADLYLSPGRAESGKFLDTLPNEQSIEIMV